MPEWAWAAKDSFEKRQHVSHRAAKYGVQGKKGTSSAHPASLPPPGPTVR